jgi:hypothetical protein
MKLIILAFLFGFTFSSLTFELKSNHPRCYLEELFNESVAMIKWKIMDLPEDSVQRSSKRKFNQSNYE